MDIEIKLSPQDLTVIYQALGELPLKVSGPVFSKLQSQVANAQSAVSSIAQQDHADRPL